MNLKKLLLFVYFSAFVVGIATVSAQSQWRGPNRDGIYPEPNLLKEWPADGPKMLW